MKIVKNLLVIFVLLPGLSFAQKQKSKEVITIEYTQKIKEQIREIKELPAEDYLKKIDSYRSEIERFMENKRRVCQGEFSTIVLDDDFQGEDSQKGLSREEKELCFREVHNLQVAFINNMFVARKRYLSFIHQQRIVELEKARDKTIANLNTKFAKKNKKLIRRKRGTRKKKK